MYSWWRRFWRWRNRNNVVRTEQSGLKPMNRWEKDYMLEPADPLQLYEDYHEIGKCQMSLIYYFVLNKSKFSYSK